MIIGLTGAHRTGKTTLARRYAQLTGAEFVETNVSATFKRLGIEPRRVKGIQERIAVQREVLKDLVLRYERIKGAAIVDRTPLDLAAYMLADVHQSINEKADRSVMAYVRECNAITARTFAAVVVVQPGIPIKDAPGKAAPVEGYMELLNQVCMGLACSAGCKAFFLPRDETDLEVRLDTLCRIASAVPTQSPFDYVYEDQVSPN